jgi:hypothetical protein
VRPLEKITSKSILELTKKYHFMIYKNKNARKTEYKMNGKAIEQHNVRELLMNHLKKENSFPSEK